MRSVIGRNGIALCSFNETIKFETVLLWKELKRLLGSTRLDLNISSFAFVSKTILNDIQV